MNYVIEFKTSVTNPDEPEDWEGSVVVSAEDISDAQDKVEAIFSPEQRNLTVMRIEAAIAQAQADAGMISQAAADEIAATANLDAVPLDAVSAEYDVVRHRMVALLNVWRRSLSPEAAKALHLSKNLQRLIG